MNLNLKIDCKVSFEVSEQQYLKKGIFDLWMSNTSLLIREVLPQPGQ